MTHLLLAFFLAAPISHETDAYARELADLQAAAVIELEHGEASWNR